MEVIQSFLTQERKQARQKRTDKDGSTPEQDQSQEGSLS